VALFSRATATGRAAIRLALKPSLVEPGESSTATISNTGEVKIGYGNPFELYRRTNGTWKRVPNQSIWTLELRLMQPGEQQRQVISVYDEKGDETRLSPGVYRYQKNVYVEALGPGDKKVTLRATFRVEAGRE
jgi:hypothetical protein